MTRARDLAAFVSNADGDIKFDTDTIETSIARLIALAWRQIRQVNK